MKPIFLFSLIFSFFTSAEVLKFDVSGYKRQLYQYKDVCREMGVKHILLVSPIDPLHMDCMGNKVSIKEFCLKKLGKEQQDQFLRGYANSKLGEVVCEMGKEALVSIGCDKRDKHFCQNPVAGCGKLQKIYAHSHQMDYHSFIEKDVDNVLNCYFSLPVKIKAAKVKEVFAPPGVKDEEIIDRDIFEFDKIQKRYLKSKNNP